MDTERYEYDDTIESDLDDDLDEERRRKRRAAQLMKQFLTMKLEEERKAYIEKFSYKMGMSLGTYVDKSYQKTARIERSISQILSDFEIFDIDDFAEFIDDGADDFETEVPGDAADKKEKFIDTFFDANLKSGIWTLLDAADLSRIAMTEELMNKIKIKLDDSQKKIVSMTIDGIELAGSETAESVKASKDNTNLYKVKDIISKAYYEKMNFSGLVGAKRFTPEDGHIEEFNRTLSYDLTVKVPDILDRNNHLFNNSKPYREMQKAVLRFVKNHENPNFSELDEAGSRKKLQDGLEQATNEVKKYLDGMGGVDSNQPYKDEYERKRVYAAREVYRILVNKRQQMDAYCRYQEYAGKLKDINEGTAYRDSSRFAAKRILDVSYEDRKLDMAQSIVLQKDFDTLCLERLKIVLNAENQPAENRLSDEQLLEQIHGCEVYKKYFENPQELSPRFAKQIIEDRLENNIIKAIVKDRPDREALSDVAGSSKVKQANVNPAGGVQAKNTKEEHTKGQQAGI